jgi:hypothetical protein
MCIGPQPTNSGLEKGRLEMSSQFTRTLVAMAAALVMSTVAIGAAIGPVEMASAHPASNAIGATLNA